MKVIEAQEGEVFDVELERDLLEANRKLAEENSALLQKNGIRAFDIMGSIGSGKTSLIEHLVRVLTPKYRLAVINGDLTTTIDSDRVRRHGATVVQINTGKECHLDANLIQKALSQLRLESLDVLFIENVGNLICPAEFPLGSTKRLVVVSVTEGPYMVVKHPYIFMDSQIVVINKVDMAKAMDVDVHKLESDALKINRNILTVLTNCRTGEGIPDVVRAMEL